MLTLATSFSDEEWQQFCGGDTKAFGRLYRQYYARLYNYGRRLLADDSTTESQLHDLFVDLWQRRDRLPAVRTVEGYLMVIWRRQIFHFLKKKRRRDVPYTQQNCDGFVFSAEDFIIDVERQQQLNHQLVAALNHLTDRQREIIYLRYYQGLELDQVAEALDINYQSVSNHLQRAYKTMRRQGTLRSALELLTFPLLLTLCTFLT